MPDLIPIFHSNDEGGFTYLERYVKSGEKYIGISPTGAIYGNRKLMHAWLKGCFARMPEGVRHHGFGVTGWETLKSFPWYSVDSSSWTGCFRYAQLTLFDPLRGSWAKIDMRSRTDALKHARVLSLYDLRPGEVHAGSYDRDRICAASVEAWQRAEEWLVQRRSATRAYVSTGVSSQALHGSASSVGKVLQATGRLYLGTGPFEAAPNHPRPLGRALAKRNKP